jgi:CRP/FNR family transcriptional regulator, anaerobic regulatory protein
VPLSSVPLRRLVQILNLDEADCFKFEQACGPRLLFGRHEIIQEEGKPADSIYLLAGGWATSSIFLPDGERQIVSIHLPGDLLGMSNTVLALAAETLTAVTAVEVFRISHTDLFSFYRKHPRLAAALFLQDQKQSVGLIDRLAAVGRTSSARRLTSLLLNIHDRIALTQPDNGTILEVPVTQVDLADALGMTPIHMNRVIKELKAANLIDYSRGGFRLNDVQKLRAFSLLPNRNWAEHLPNLVQHV